LPRPGSGEEPPIVLNMATSVVASSPGRQQVAMNDKWLFALLILLVLGSAAAAVWIIVEWIWSDTPKQPRPWQRRPRSRDSEEGPGPRE
jgi:hypothetical protein